MVLIINVMITYNLGKLNKDASRKIFTIYVSVYNTQPLLQLKYAGISVDYTIHGERQYFQE